MECDKAVSNVSKNCFEDQLKGIDTELTKFDPNEDSTQLHNLLKLFSLDHSLVILSAHSKIKLSSKIQNLTLKLNMGLCPNNVLVFIDRYMMV